MGRARGDMGTGRGLTNGTSRTQQARRPGQAPPCQSQVAGTPPPGTIDEGSNEGQACVTAEVICIIPASPLSAFIASFRTNALPKMSRAARHEAVMLLTSSVIETLRALGEKPKRTHVERFDT